MTSSVPVLVKRHVFGINDRLTKNIAFLDSSVLIYVAGRNIVFYNIEEHSQRFVVGSSPSPENWVSDPEICAISLSPSTRYLSIAEKGEKPAVTILDTQTFRKKKVLAIPSIIRSKQICSMSFSANNLFLAIQCGSPDYKLCIFEWEKGLMQHCITTSKDQTPIHQIQYCYNHTDPLPNDPNLIAICHQNCVQIHTQNHKEMKQESVEMKSYEADNKKFHCLCWIEETLVCGNSVGDVIVIKNNKFEKIIFSKTDCAISCLECIINQNKNRPILVIGADDCTLSFLQKKSENVNNNEWNCICAMSLCSDMSSNHNKDYRPVPVGMSLDSLLTKLMISTANKQIYSVDISPLTQTAEKSNFNLPISQPLGHFHFSGICGMDICVRKPWIVTCSYDRSICIWNYVTKKLEICKYFSQTIHSVSFHPSGLHILAGFEDKLKLLNVLMDDIESYKDFHIVRACKECQFSNGGHIFAAVNGDKIHIYNTYSGELVSILRGHNQKIKSLYFSLDDTSLISAGAEGAVYEWSMFSFNRMQEMVNRQCPLNTAIITKDKKIYCTGKTPLLNEIIDGNLEKEIDMGGIEINRLIISNSVPQKFIFSSTVNGLVRCMTFPFANNQNNSESHGSNNNNNNSLYLDYIGHLGKINRISISKNDKYLFSAGENDALINIFEIRDKEGRNSKAETSEICELWSTEILVTQSYLFEKRQLILELGNKVDELKLHNEYQLRLREMHFEDTLKDKQLRFNKELKTEKLKYEVLKDEQRDLEMEYEEKIKLAEDQHCKRVTELESFYQSQLMGEIDKFEKLEIALNNKQSKWESDTFQKKDAHSLKCRDLKTKFEHCLQTELNQKAESVFAFEYLQKEYRECKSQLLTDFDTESQELELKYHSILSEERENTLRLKGENGVMKKKFITLQNEIDDQNEESKKVSLQQNNFKKQIILLKKEIETLDIQMQSRDNIIGDKEKKIYKLKKKNQNLEKHKFVLDYKIKSLKKQIEPRQNKILAMKDSVKKLDFELEKLHKKNGDLKEIITEIHKKSDSFSQKILNKKEKYKKLELITNRFYYDLTQIIAFIQTPKRLKQYFVEQMYNKNKRKSLLLFVDTNYEINTNILDEYERHKQYLNVCANDLKKKLSKQSQTNQTENYQIMIKNTKYMNEIKDLQKELKSLTQSLPPHMQHKKMGNNESESQTQMLQSEMQKQHNQIKQLKHEIQSLQKIK